MTRIYSDFNTDLSKEQLTRLADKSTSPVACKSAMTLLGERLGEVIAAKIKDYKSTLYLACTVEDADYLATGMLSPLEQHLQSVRLACFWNKRFSPFGISGLNTSPIIRQYKEPACADITYLVVVKSVISSGCVIKTNLTNLIQTLNPDTIFIAAPVIYTGAAARLSAEFEASIYEKFQFIYLAEDDERSAEGEVLPGIGGMVYDRLGFGSQDEKNKYVPEIVKVRRAQHVVKT